MHANTTDGLDPLISDMLEWLDGAPRTLAEAREAWRTSCPRLTVWEDAHERGFVERTSRPDGGQLLTVTAAGRQFLAARQQARPALR